MMDVITHIFIVDKSALKASTYNDILCLLVIIGLYGLFIPIVSYYTWQYSKVRNHACIKPRRPWITIYVVIIIICMFANRILGCVNAIYSELAVLRVLYILGYSVGNHSILWLCTIKYWLLYYDVQFILFCENNQWKTHINENNVTYHTNWFVVNKTTAGNEQYLIRKVLMIIAFPSIIVPLVTFIRYTTQYDAMIDLFFMIIPIALTAIFWGKTPKYLDYFRVREECRMLLVIGATLAILYLIGGVTAAFLLSPHDYFIAAYSVEVMYWLGITLAALHLTCWTILKNKHRLTVSQTKSSIYMSYRSFHRLVSPKKAESERRRTSMHSLRVSQSGLSLPDDVNINANESIILLICILEHAHGFQMFISHLMSEFCLESVLAIIEFTQYQMLMKNIYSGSKGKEVDIKALRILKLPDISVVPQSIIVYDPKNESGVYEVKEIAKRLLQKYIVNGSEFEINISYKLKRKLLNDLDRIEQLEETKLVHLFDESIQSLLLLLNDCLARFVTTPKYKQIEKELNELAMAMEEEANKKRQRELSVEEANPDEVQRMATNNHLKIQSSNSNYTKVSSPSNSETVHTITPLVKSGSGDHDRVVSITEDGQSKESTDIMMVLPSDKSYESN
eukprot:99539_1